MITTKNMPSPWYEGAKDRNCSNGPSTGYIRASLEQNGSATRKLYIILEFTRHTCSIGRNWKKGERSFIKVLHYKSHYMWSLGTVADNQNGNLRWYLPWREGASRGSRVPHTYSEKWFFWKPFRFIPWLLKRVLHLVWDPYYVYIVVEVTLNMAK